MQTLGPQRCRHQADRRSHRMAAEDGRTAIQRIENPKQIVAIDHPPVEEIEGRGVVVKPCPRASLATT